MGCVPIRIYLQNARVFDIADAMFTQVPEDEKKRLTGDFQKTGSYRGYKPRQTWVSFPVAFCHCS